MSSRRTIVDTDTAGDDATAILLALRSDRVEVEGLTVVAGNVEFDREVENAKHTLELAGRADDVPVHEGTRSPLLKGWEHSTEVHGEGGFGGSLFPETDVPSADEDAVEYIVRRARELDGELSLLCLGPLTNVALALKREPRLSDLLDEVWVMGGAVHTVGNVTPAAEFNFWADPDAARLVVRELDVALVDWGVTVRDGPFRAADFERVEGFNTDLADFFLTVSEAVRAFDEAGDGATQPDPLAAACMCYPELRESVGTYPAAVDEREGPTRGHLVVDTVGTTDRPARTTVVESVDAERFRAALFGLLEAGDPDRPFR